MCQLVVSLASPFEQEDKTRILIEQALDDVFPGSRGEVHCTAVSMLPQVPGAESMRHIPA